MGVLGHYRLEIFKDLTSGDNIYIDMAFFVNSNLRGQNKLLGKIGVGGTITEVLRVL